MPGANTRAWSRISCNSGVVESPSSTSETKVGTMIVPIFVIVVSLFDVLANPPFGPSLIDTKGGLMLVFIATLTPLATWLLYTQVREM